VQDQGDQEQQPADKQPPAASLDFYDLAQATLADAKSIILFRRVRVAHPEWNTLSRQIPKHLVEARDELEEAEQAASLARHEYEQALGGRFYNEWIERTDRDPIGTMAALKARAEQSQARLTKAVSDVTTTHQERTKAENALADAWLRDRCGAFRQRRGEYAAMLALHRRAIEGRRTDRYELRGWKDTCACTVLMQVADLIVQVRGDDRSGSDGLARWDIGQRVADLDQDAWRDLLIDVRQEAASVTPGEPHGKAPLIPVAQVLATLKMLHEAVKGIHGNLSTLVDLVSESNDLAVGLCLIDDYLLRPVGQPGAGRQERDELWRVTLRDLRTHLVDAKRLWESEIAGVSLQVRFAGTSQGTINCGPLNDLTYHGLVATIGSVMRDPNAPGAVPEYAVAEFAGASLIGMRGVVRKRVAEALKARRWFREANLALDKEYARAVGTARQEATRPTERHPASESPPPPPPPSPPAVAPLLFARPVDAKQKCLEALAAAPNGIPRHEDIATATGLEYQTVKEAMRTQKKADYVEKQDGAWIITTKGRERLKLLRGE
jgi:hypothetical protein